MKHELTDRELRILSVIIGAINFRGFPPQSRQIAKRLDIPDSTVRSNLYSLRDKGYIKIVSRQPNGIRLLRDIDGDPVSIIVRIEKVTV